ncbi:MAG: CAP domain-containing protein [Gaiellaceae bacterium]
MRGTRLIIATIALAAAAGGLAAAVGAGNDQSTQPSLRWHAPSRLGVIDDRLKRAVAPDTARPTAWREAREAREVASRGNAWRTASRPSVGQGQAAATAGSYDAQLVDALNDVRDRYGLPALRVSERLEAAAELHSRNMGRIGFFAHESADGSPFWKRVERFYGPHSADYWAVGENLIYGSPSLSVEEAVQGWMNSPGHRANVVSRDWREIGLSSVRLESAPGVYKGQQVTIVTCDFGVRR